MIGIGMAQGENKAKEAAAKAIQSPLLEAQITGAKSAIVNVTGGPNITIYDSSIAVDYIREAAGNDIDIIYGVAINDDIGENIIVTVIATGFDLPDHSAPQTSTVVSRKQREVEENDRLKPEVIISKENEDNDIPDFFKTR